MTSIVMLALALIALGAAGTIVIRLLENQREGGDATKGGKL